MRPIAETLVEAHFATLGETDVLELGDAYSRLLKPDRTTGGALDHLLKAFADVLVAGKAARWRHVNYFTFLALGRAIDQLIETPLILETGSSAHGTNSSMLLAALAEQGGGRFDTVDINPATTQRLQASLAERFGASPRLHCHTGDSVAFLQAFAGTANIVYLDSYDLNPGDFQNSARHGLAEFEALLPKLQPTTLILIDDTPKSRDIFRKMTPPDYLAAVDQHIGLHNRLPGKGELIAEAIRTDRRFQILDWQYQLLLLYRA